MELMNFGQPWRTKRLTSCRARNTRRSTKQWLITTVEHHFYQVFDLFDSLGFKDTEERWQYMRRFERAMKLIKQGPDEPTP